MSLLPKLKLLRGGTSRRKLEVGSNSTRAVHYFTQTQLAVAIEAGDEVHSAAPSTD